MKLGIGERALALVLDSLEGREPHDWVNGLATKFGRPRVMACLADLWCEMNPSYVGVFVEELLSAEK
jgi:hypothetical protein